VAHEEQLQWEARYGKLAALAAFGSALMSVASVVVLNSALGTYNDSAELLVAVHKHPAATVAASVLQALASVLIIPVLLYLLTATRARRPETPRQLQPFTLIAPVVAAILGIASSALQVRAAHDYFHPLVPLAPKDAVKHADHLISQSPGRAAAYIAFIAAFAVGGTIALVSVNAMRAGLLSKFIGILGVILGVLTAIPLFFGGPSIIQFFWLLALGVLFLNRWPGERGPAWASGEAIPWPSAAEVRARQQGERETEPEPAATATATATQPRSKKRKRKRRR
jgi:hypothetical protein